MNSAPNCGDFIFQKFGKLWSKKCIYQPDVKRNTAKLGQNPLLICQISKFTYLLTNKFTYLLAKELTFIIASKFTYLVANKLTYLQADKLNNLLAIRLLNY